MSDGYLVHGKCVGVAVAYDYYYSHAKPEIRPGETTYHASYIKYNDEWHIRIGTISSGGEVNYTIEPINPPQLAPCDTTESFYDGMLIAWGIVIAMVAAWGIKQLGRALT